MVRLGGVISASVATDPSTIFGANLIAWYKADVGVTTSGTDATAWADQSGNSHDLTGTVAQYPQYSATGFNTAYPGITFSTTTGIFSTTTFNLNSNIASFFMVLNFQNTGSHFRIASYYDPAGLDYGSTSGIDLISDNSAVESVHNFSSQSFAFSTGNLRYSLTFDGPGATITLYNANGSPVTYGTGNDTLGSASNVLRIGLSLATSANFIAAEIVLTNSVATSGQRSSMDTYLQTRWGL